MTQEEYFFNVEKLKMDRLEGNIRPDDFADKFQKITYIYCKEFIQSIYDEVTDKLQQYNDALYNKKLYNEITMVIDNIVYNKFQENPMLKKMVNTMFDTFFDKPEDDNIMHDYDDPDDKVFKPYFHDDGTLEIIGMIWKSIKFGDK